LPLVEKNIYVEAWAEMEFEVQIPGRNCCLLALELNYFVASEKNIIWMMFHPD